MAVIRSQIDTWSPLRTFGAVVRAGSFTGAARALGLSQSSVSRHVAELEARAGRPLFARRGRRVTLTEAGEALVGASASVESAVASLERAVASLAPGVSGEVRVASVPELVTNLLAPRAPALLARHPGLRLSLRGRQEIERLTTGEADVALRVVAPADAELVRRRAGAIRYRLFGTRQGLAASPRRFAAYDRSLAALPEARWVAAHVDEASIALRADPPSAVAAACAAGPLVAVLPEPLAALHPSLQAESSVLFERPLYVVAHRELARAPSVRAVVGWLVECAAELSAPPTRAPGAQRPAAARPPRC